MGNQTVRSQGTLGLAQWPSTSLAYADVADRENAEFSPLATVSSLSSWHHHRGLCWGDTENEKTMMRFSLVLSFLASTHAVDVVGTVGGGLIVDYLEPSRGASRLEPSNKRACLTRKPHGRGIL